MPENETASVFSAATPGCTTVRRLLLQHLMQERDMLLCEALRILGSPDRAEDVLQDAAVRCLSSRALTDVPDNPRGLLRQMVRNLALDHHRKQAREATDEADADTLVCPAVPIERRLSAAEQAACLTRALARLPDNRRHAFVEARIKARRQTEIAKEMNVSPARVHALIQAAHDQLMGELPELW